MYYDTRYLIQNQQLACAVTVSAVNGFVSKIKVYVHIPMQGIPQYDFEQLASVAPNDSFILS